NLGGRGLGRTRSGLLFFLWLLANLSATRSVRGQLTVLVNDHDRIGAGRHVEVWSLLHTRCSCQLNITGGSGVDRFIGSTDRAGRRPTIRIRPVADEADITFRDRSFEALIFSLRNKHR